MVLRGDEVHCSPREAVLRVDVFASTMRLASPKLSLPAPLQTGSMYDHSKIVTNALFTQVNYLIHVVLYLQRPSHESTILDTTYT